MNEATQHGEMVRLRALAEAATPGPWVENVLGSEGYDVRANPDPSGNPIRRIRVARCGYEKWETDRANAEYIAAFDPPTVLDLLDRLAAVEAVLSRRESVYGPGTQVEALTRNVRAVLAAPPERTDLGASEVDR